MTPGHTFPFRTASGFRPLKGSGLHIGHYGAVLRDICSLQYVREGCSFVFIADHHSRSKWTDRSDFVNTRTRTTELTRQLLAAGVDPDYSVIYRQSDVPEIFEFMWFLAGVTAHGPLANGHALKAANEKTAGVYLYPLLMIADVLSLRATHVIVGSDQKIHIDLARDVAGRLRREFGDDFLPQPEYHRAPPLLYPGHRGTAKMDSEQGNDISLFGEEATVREKIEAIVTQDVGRGAALTVEGSTILAYAEALGGQAAYDSLAAAFANPAFRYRDAKERLFELYMDIMGPSRTAYQTITAADAEEVLRKGGLRAREAVGNMIAEVRKHISLSI